MYAPIGGSAPIGRIHADNYRRHVCATQEFPEGNCRDSLAHRTGLRMTAERESRSRGVLLNSRLSTPQLLNFSTPPAPLSMAVACFITASVIWLPESMRASSRTRSFSAASGVTLVRVRPARSNFST